MEKIVIATFLYIIVGLYVGTGIWAYTVSRKSLGSYLKHFLGTDVIRKAQQLIEAGPLNGDNCSDWCPWCAIAKAKGLLDNEYGTGVAMSEAICQVVTGHIVELPSDEPLVEARKALLPFNSTDVSALTQEGALSILQQANKSLRVVPNNSVINLGWKENP